MILELENICKEYMQGKIPVPVLKNINFSMEEGEYVAIMGPSGSGKTTLMNIVGCLDQATSGRLILDGQDISKCSDNQMSDIRLQKIGFVFQNFQLLARQSAMENVCLPLTYAGVPKKERRERAAIALERVGLGDRIPAFWRIFQTSSSSVVFISSTHMVPSVGTSRALICFASVDFPLPLCPSTAIN